MSRCSLVHPSTSKLGPADQAKGNYEYTPPVVRAYLLGEVLSEEDLQDVTEFYAGQGLPLPTFPAEPALAGQFKDNVSGCQRTADEIPRRIVRKVVAQEKPPRKPLEDIVAVALSCYTPLQKETLFNKLAADLGYSVE